VDCDDVTEHATCLGDEHAPAHRQGVERLRGDVLDFVRLVGREGSECSECSVRVSWKR